MILELILQIGKKKQLIKKAEIQCSLLAIIKSGF